MFCTPEIFAAAKLTGKQNGPAPVTWKMGTAPVKFWKLVGFAAVERSTSTGVT